MSRRLTSWPAQFHICLRGLTNLEIPQDNRVSCDALHHFALQGRRQQMLQMLKVNVEAPIP